MTRAHQLTIPQPERETTMYSQRRQNLEFVTRFVDSVTIRPFLEDLRRVKRATELFPLVAKTRPEPATRAA
jgi:hypothetical protein